MLGLGAWALACTPNASGVGGSGAIGVYDGGGTTEVGGTTGPGGTDPGVQTGSADGTGGSGTSTSDDGPATTLPPDDSGDGEESGSTTTTTGEPSDGTSTGGDPPAMELLQHASFDACNLPLWCYSGDIFTPAGGPMWMQECFTASLTPPFELTQLEAVVPGLHPALGTVEVQVRRRNGPGNSPGMTIGSRAVSVVPGHNTIAVVPPIVIDEAEVCIGLAAPQSGLAGALGVAVNESSTIGGISWFRLEGGGGCNYPSWTDVIAETPDPTGNWCIRGTIVEQ